MRRLFGAVCAGASSIATALAAPPPAELFTRPPAWQAVQLSPSGKRLAMIIRTETGWQAAAVLDLPVKGPAHPVAAFSNADVTRLHWVNDDRLVLDAFEPGTEVREGGGGVFAVDHDGSRLQQLVSWQRDIGGTTGTHIVNHLLPYGWFVSKTLDDGSADVVMEQRMFNALGEHSGSKLARLDTLTGRLKTVGQGRPNGATSWVLDEAGEPRVVRDLSNGRDRLVMREGTSEDWVVLQDVPLHSRSGLQPMFLEADGTLVVRGYLDADTLGYFSYDLKARKLEPQPLVRVSRYDVGGIEFDAKTRRVVGVHLTTSQPQSVWFESRMAGIQKAVDAALPRGRFNTVSCGHCDSSPYYVVFSRSDRQPGAYFLYDHAGHKLQALGETRPWIDETSQGERAAHWVTARDGVAFPVIVTTPPGALPQQPLPAVVVVHGGPWVDGSDRSWDAEAQFLASRGWRVIEPSFRGTTGLGWALFRAGWKQWGEAMQDDLADAVQWAVAQKLVDPDRVCIYGGSYGGYAALMGPIRHPGTYRCAASFAGVTDIDLMYTSARSDLTRDSRRYSMPELIGDPDRDAEQLRKASPLVRAAEIKVPVLLVQGGLDRRVPREHADRFERAARAGGVAIERVDYAEEGHGWALAADHADFLDRLDRFLARSLGAPTGGR